MITEEQLKRLTHEQLVHMVFSGVTSVAELEQIVERQKELDHPCYQCNNLLDALTAKWTCYSCSKLYKRIDGDPIEIDCNSWCENCLFELTQEKD